MVVVGLRRAARRLLTAPTPGRRRRTRRRAWSLFGVALAAALLFAVPCAGITVRAETDRRSVAPGETLLLTVTTEGSLAATPRVELPVIDGVRFYASGTSQSYTMLGGRTTATVEATYQLTVTRTRDFTIPALTVIVGDATYRTQPIPVVVDATGSSPAPNVAPRGGPSAPSPPPATPGSGGGARAGAPGDEVFITTSVDRDEVYVGEQLVLSFRYLRRVQPWDNPSYQPPETEGFWREDLPPEQRYRTSIGGYIYQVTEIRYALYPTRTGELTIGPAELSFPEDLFDRFFSRRRSRGPRQLRTDPLEITVRELPQPRPEGFAGLVARSVDLRATVDRDTVPRGEPATLHLELDTDGFLQSFGGLAVKEPEEARLHDSQDDLSHRNVDGRRFSLLVEEKVIVPQREGRLELEPVAVTYFDPESGRYRTAEARPRALVVLPSDLPVVGDDESGLVRSEIARLARDLAFVHPVPRHLARRAKPLPETAGWWALATAPLLLLVGWRIALERRAALRRDPALLRRRGAVKRARGLLRDARRAGDRTAALATLGRAVAGYVADRCDRPLAAVDAGEVRRFAAALGAEAVGHRLASLLEICDRERFGVATDAAPNLDELVAEADRALRELERARGVGDGRSGSRAVAARGLALLLLVGAATLAPADGRAQETGPARGGVAERLMAEGNRAYTDGDVDAAKDLYRQALAAGADGAELHYNLGNAHARRGELGRAVVSYLRALRRDPRDGDARANLAWVRSHLRDLELSAAGLPPGMAQLAAIAHFLSLNQWSVVLVLLVWTICALLAWAWWHGGVGDGLRRGLLALAAGLVLAVGFTGWRYYDERIRDVGVVVVEEVAVRSGPAETFPVVFQIHDGLTVDLREIRAGWQQISLGGDWVGWVPQDAVLAVRPSRL